MQQRDIKWYGWKPGLPSPKDHCYKITSPVPLPAVVDLSDKCPPVYNQGELGSCTANAIGAAYEFDLLKQGKSDFMPSRLFLYYNERFIENSVGYDSGAQIRDGLTCLIKQGICSENIVPYDVDKFSEKPSEEAYTQALNFTINNYQKLADGNLYMMKQCLAQGIPFVFGFTVYESFESEEVASTGILPPLDNTEQEMGGHAVMCVGYDETKNMVKIRNSWGNDWGAKGYFYMPYNYISNSNLANDFWAINTV